MNIYETFIEEFENINNTKKKENINTLIQAVQNYYSCYCQYKALDAVRNYVKNTYNCKGPVCRIEPNKLSYQDLLLEEFYFKLYSKNAWGPFNLDEFCNHDRIVSARMDYEDCLHVEFLENVEISPLSKFAITGNTSGKKYTLFEVLESTCRKVQRKYPAKETTRKNKDCSFMERFSKLHKYMDMYEGNRELRTINWKTAIQEVFEEEGIQYLLDIVHCPDGVEPLYIQPIRGVFVECQDSKDDKSIKNKTIKKYMKPQFSISLAKTKQKTKENVEKIAPVYEKYARTKKMLAEIEKKFEL